MPENAARLRAATVADLPAVHALNELEVPHVARVPIERFAWFLEHASDFLVAEGAGVAAGADDAPVAAFVVALEPDAPYRSPNFLWFREHRARFLYVDRIAVAPAWRRCGLGRAIYRELARRARDRGLDRITCEVNLEPPNPDSLAFHRRIGFQPAGTLEGAGGEKSGQRVVQLLEWLPGLDGAVGGSETAG